MDVIVVIVKRVSRNFHVNEVRSLSCFMKRRYSLSSVGVRLQKNEPVLLASNRYFCSSIFSTGEQTNISNSKSVFRSKGETSRNNAGDSNSYSLRTHNCGELRRSHEGCNVRLCGWVEFIRYDKFLVLRDAYGSTQIILSYMPAVCSGNESLNFESVISVEGTVVLRPPDQANPKMLTGDIEVSATNITILGSAPKQLPFNIRGFQSPTEPLSMQYRYLYLRYPHMQKTLRLRSSFLHDIRKFLIHKQFVDVETPTLFCRTPGGAQEFIVPTQSIGLYYSLVQSPQQFKQLLMVGGLDRYFQIARCYRDESTRPDRQPEFTQLDIELSFVDREGVISLIEDLLVACWPNHLTDLSAPFPRLSFSEAFSQYGSDKPDLRFDSKILDVTPLAECAEYKEASRIFEQDDFTLRAVLFPSVASAFTRSQWEELQKNTQLNWSSSHLFIVPFKQIRDVSKALGHVLSKQSIESIISSIQVNKGDLLILGFGPENCVLEMLGNMRVHVADCLENKGHTVRKDGFHFAWIVDFPLFEKKANGVLNSAHHPFTQPHPEDIHLLDSHPLKVRSLHYDLVLNGAEVGGGSIRISNVELQRHILQNHLHITTDSLQHLLDALSMGCPPHGGIALGIDRLVASICGAKTIRDVIAFPKGSSGQDLMSHAPSPLSQEDARLYGLPFPQSFTKS